MSQLQRQNEREAQRYLAQLGNSEGVTRFASKYGIASTKRIYLISLVLYFRWLKSIGVVLTPDELVEDNLKCFFNSQPTDVRTKRRHTDWLDRYINRNMVEEGYNEAMRTVTAAAIQQFYGATTLSSSETFRSRGPRQPQSRSLSNPATSER